MKPKIKNIAAAILICGISAAGVFTYINKDIIFRRGNPIPYIMKILYLSEDNPYIKVFKDKEIYISKGKGDYLKAQDRLIRFVVDKYDATFLEQAGSGYIFESGDQNINLNSEIYLKDYNIWEISDKQKNELADLIPMVKIKGELYLDTGRESDINGRCGVMDGEITSTVEPSEKPIQDDQSNFGSGYEYQFVDDNSIDIYMNEKWIRFEKRDAK